MVLLGHKRTILIRNRGKMSEFHDVLAKNPYRVARVKADMTQKVLAELAGVSVQYVYRNENGLVNTPSVQLANILGIDEYIMNVDFYAWVIDMRRLVGKAYRAFNMGEAMYSENVNPANEFALNISAMYAIEFDPIADNSKQFFCRIMCLHPRTVQQFLSNNGELSPTFEQALWGCEFPAGVVTTLMLKCKAWASDNG